MSDLSRKIAEAVVAAWDDRWCGNCAGLADLIERAGVGELIRERNEARFEADTRTRQLRVSKDAFDACDAVLNDIVNERDALAQRIEAAVAFINRYPGPLSPTTMLRILRGDTEAAGG